MHPSQFRNPPKEFREVPFWSWNDILDPDELVRQVALIDEAGWGGFFMHARVGLRTPYLGKDWMACIRACVDEARARGMGAWLYDEDKWPSGYGGGLTVAAHPEYRAQYLLCKVDNRPALVAERIAMFAAREVDGQLVDVRRCDAPDLETSADRVVQFYPQTMPLGMPWFNDYCYLNVLNPAAVRAFLDSTHDLYKRAVGEEFGRTIPGVLTDEPCYLFSDPRAMRQPAIPWSDELLAEFHRRNGYDLVPHLPSLFFEVDDYQAVRYDFWCTVTECYVQSYTRQIHAWCQANRLSFTGHQMCEDTLASQVRWIGAAMPHYAHMDVPGVDKLARVVNSGAGTVLTIKQLDSVACQMGKPRTLCENYGCGGQDFAHAGRKWIGDWAFVLGINLNNPHLALYSLRGERKRDYPQNLFFQQPWWPDNRLVADYFARLGWVLSQGKRVVDVLVIHPIGSAWALYSPLSSHAVDGLDRALDEMLTTLLRRQRDFHLADEMLMAQSEILDVRILRDAQAPQLALGQMAYRVVIVPPSVTLTANTVNRLREFALAGGIVLAVEPIPERVDGRLTDEALLPPTTRFVTVDALPDVLDDLIPFDVRIPGCSSIWYHHRRINDSDCYLIANTDLERGQIARVQLRGAGRLEEWDAATGDVHPVAAREQDGVTEAVLEMPPAGSHLLVLHRDQPPIEVEPAVERVSAEIALDGDWRLSLEGLNSITCDTPRLKIGDGEWTAPMHVLDAHVLASRSGIGTRFSLEYTFDAAERPPDPTCLAVEMPERYTLRVNGQAVPCVDEGWWIDTAFRKVDVSAAVRGGRNVIELSGVLAADMELESIYVIGRFGVAGRRLGEENRFNGQVFDRYASDWRLTGLTDVVRATRDRDRQMVDLTALGFPFLAEPVTLRQTVTLGQIPTGAIVELHGLRAAVAHVRINGQEMGAVAWPPHRVNVTSGLQRGENTLEIDLAGTLRNLLGPHHLKDGDLEWTGAAQFRDKGRWTDDTILVPFGFRAVTLRLLESQVG